VLVESAWEDPVDFDAPFDAFVDRMEDTPGVDFDSQRVPSGGHVRSVPDAFENGLRHVFGSGQP
jgi:hypothetical protein